MFKLLGILLALYIAYAMYKGEVGAKSGIRWVSVNKEAAPKYFWLVLACYAILSVSLMTLF
jgi:hypothetical protein